MRLGRIRPDEESFSNIWMILAFLLVWYGTHEHDLEMINVNTFDVKNFLVSAYLFRHQAWMKSHEGMSVKESQGESIWNFQVAITIGLKKENGTCRKV